MSPLWLVLLLPIFGEAARFNCKGRILGAYYADAKSGCKAFHVCVRVAGGGIRDFRFFCPPGTLFHQEAQTCTDWGDDDPLACPVDLYDGFDTKKVTSQGNRDEEVEFGLQRAETGDSRLQNSVTSNGGSSDLRAAHSSDFFSGQRDRGRDDSVPQSPASRSSSRQSFRRVVTSPRAPTTSTQYTTPSSPLTPNSPDQFDVSKRKLVRKRPVYKSTEQPSTFSQNAPRQQQFLNALQKNYEQHNRQNPTLPAHVPPQYREEYVEVSKVSPKENKFVPYTAAPAPFSQTSAATQIKNNKGLVEVYNYEAQSTPKSVKDNRAFKVQNSYTIQTTEVQREKDYLRINNNVNNDAHNGLNPKNPTTPNYNPAPSRQSSSSIASNKNYNSVTLEPQKKNFPSFTAAKQNYYNNPTTPSTTTYFTTLRSETPSNLNTVAYNTNNGFNALQTNYVDNNEDDGQYRQPSEEDDGQYRPELYERELLSGAHSLNIAASGNRLPEDQKQHSKSTFKPTPQTASPRSFNSGSRVTYSTESTYQTREPTYTTTVKQQVNNQRTFDYFQTYTTTSRPTESPVKEHGLNFVSSKSTPARVPTIGAEQTTRGPLPSSTTHRPTKRPPSFVKSANNKEDASYDYAYYDSDTGFSEYDHIEEFGKTKTKV